MRIHEISNTIRGFVALLEIVARQIILGTTNKLGNFTTSSIGTSILML